MSADKNEEPTSKKIEDAKKKGQIAVSKDLARLATLVAVLETAFVSEPLWRASVQGLMNVGIAHVGQEFFPAVMQVVVAAGSLLLIVFFVGLVMCIIVSTAAHWGQFGVLISTDSITPKFDKLNPANGIKQLFSMKKMVELLIAVGKASLLGWIIYVLVRSQLPAIVSLSSGEPKDIYYAFIALVHSIFHAVVVVCFCLGIVDFAIQKYFHKKELMMDMEEIKREHKESDGDPLIKGQRKRLARQWANEASVEKTQGANAVVVNPTHFAVAMYYDAAETMVPVVLAKGKDEVAQAMIARARECGIPVIRHVWLARSLYATCRPDTVVPKSSYEAVAHVYAVVHELVATQQTHKEVALEIYGEHQTGTPPQT